MSAMALNAEPTPYLFAVFDPETGMMYGTPSMNGRQSKDFARSVGGICVRWPVEQAIDTDGPGWIATEWRRRG